CCPTSATCSATPCTRRRGASGSSARTASGWINACCATGSATRQPAQPGRRLRRQEEARPSRARPPHKEGNVSILSFPDRGPWGDSRYRGNASGHIYRELYQQLQPKDIVEVFAGSGTAKQVADELGIPIVALDLKDGFDATRHSILEKVGHESDLVFGHAPYGTMIRYSGSVWGEKPHPADLSHIEDVDEFIDAMQAVLLNQREATRPGGVYGTLTGDIRKEGRYTSLQAEYI